MNEFKVTIEQFEGPLDLMLHLIKEKELDLLHRAMAIVMCLREAMNLMEGFEDE